jgi:hypothetical protein
MTFSRNRVIPRIALLSAMLLVPFVRAQAQSAAGTEDSIRAALVQRLTLFVEWPEWKMDASHPQFNVCLIGSDPIGPALSEAFRDKSVQQKTVVFTHVDRLDRALDCHLLYVGSNASRQVQRDVATLEHAAVLTVSDRVDAARQGAIVGLPRDESRVRIEVNLKAATGSKLVISSRLLRLATITEMP